jgi:hypothetical protein
MMLRDREPPSDEERDMRAAGLFMVIVFFTAIVAAQTPQRGRGTAAPRPVVRANASKPDGDLAQVMRGILFPNSNVLFDVQQHDPAVPVKKPGDAAGGSASQVYANAYTGWQVVEGAAVALEESADIILKPGRLCSNGKPVPVGRPDFVRFAQALREAGRKALVAARAKNQEQASDVTNDVAEACSNCHEVYRDKGPAGSPARCTP